ncbi:MAG: dihydrolipoamide acetyltransferase family protein [Rhodoferax sp.]
MAVQHIKMPDIGEGIAEVELVAWRVAVGDAVAEDQIVADVMTDKATVEIPSHLSGVVVALNAQPGQVVPVGTPIIGIETGAESSAKNQAPAQSEKAVEAPENIAIQAPAAPTAAPSVAPQAVAAPSEPLKIAQKTAVSPVDTAQGTPEKVANSGRVRAAPAVRRRAAELGLDLARIPASGDQGEVTHADLDRALAGASAQGVRGGTAAGVPAPTPAVGAAAAAAPEDEVLDVVPVIGLRRKIAEKMQTAKRQIPHFSYVEEIDVTELEALRAQLNARYGDSRGRLTLLPLLIRALVLALAEHPQINARYDEASATLTRYRAVHLGLATQTPGGLMVPVIRNVQALDLWGCAAAIRATSEAARSGRAPREMLSGSTITVTSLGPLAGIAHTPVINHPEVAIVGPNRIVERLVPLDGQPVVRKMMNLSSSFDHRVVDGMDAAEFIQSVRQRLECPGLLWATGA